MCKEEIRLLGLCYRVWEPAYNNYRLHCETGLFVIFCAFMLAVAIGLIVLCIGWAFAQIQKAKRSGINVESIIRDARRRAYVRGRDGV
jgi:hypothetical protein